MNNQEFISKQKAKQTKPKENWSYLLSEPHVVSGLFDASNRITSIIDEKDKILETLRNPIAENSIPWRKDRQSDLVDSFSYLVSICIHEIFGTPELEWSLPISRLKCEHMVYPYTKALIDYDIFSENSIEKQRRK